MPDLGSFESPSVLVVDDEADWLKEIRRLLKREGFEVSTARSGKAALQAIEKKEPDLVVLDVSIPDMGGVEVLEAVRQRHPESPVIFITHEGELAQAREALELGAFDYVLRRITRGLDEVAAEDLIVRCRRAVETLRQRSEKETLSRRTVSKQRTSISAAVRPERAAMERAALARVTNFVSQAISKASTQALEQALGEAGPSMALTDVLSEALLEDATEGDWAAALLRGARLKRELLREAGGTLSATEVGTLLGISRAAVDKRRRQGALLGLKLPSGDIAYPAAQFSEKDVVPGLREVLGSFHVQDSWMQIDALLARDESLGGRTPLEALAEGDVELVKATVSSFGDQGL